MRLFAAAVFLLMGSLAFSHPVSYKGAVSLMSYNSSQMNEVLLNYSFNHRLAVGMMYVKADESEIYLPRVNYLAKRWNNEDSQGNFYISGGAGAEKYNSNVYGVRMAEVVLDWESRKYYTSLEHLYFSRDNKNHLTWTERDDHRTKLRLGFAPFLADYNDLNIWFITQFSKQNNQTPLTTQFLRFYIKNVLWEIGADLNGGYAFNFMIHL